MDDFKPDWHIWEWDGPQLRFLPVLVTSYQVINDVAYRNPISKPDDLIGPFFTSAFTAKNWTVEFIYDIFVREIFGLEFACGENPSNSCCNPVKTSVINPKVDALIRSNLAT